MIRFTKALAAAAAVLILPAVSNAAVIQIVSVTGDGASGTLLRGQTVTFNLAIDYQGQAPNTVTGLSADVTGYDLPGITDARELGLQMVGGTSVDQLLGIDIGAGQQFGLDNVNGTTPVEVFETNLLNPVAVTTNMFGGISTSPVPGDGSADGSIPGSPGVLFQVTFQNVFDLSDTATTANLSFDLTLVDASANATTTSTGFALTVVPEPGTALLMGLGLAGLATTRRR